MDLNFDVQTQEPDDSIVDDTPDDLEAEGASPPDEEEELPIEPGQPVVPDPNNPLQSHLKALIYGPPGHGKTIFGARAPNVLLVEIDPEGALSLLNPDLPDAEELRVVYRNRIIIREFNDIDALFWRLKAGEFPGIDTIFLDPLSEAQKKGIDRLIETNAEPKRAHPMLAGRQTYGISANVMRRMVLDFLQLPYHVIATSHAKEIEKEGRPTVIRPDLTPAFANAALGLFSVIGYLSSEIDNVELTQTRSLQIQPSRIVWAKSRLGGLPPIIQEPTFQQLVDAFDRQMALAQELDKEA